MFLIDFLFKGMFVNIFYYSNVFMLISTDFLYSCKYA